jgi:hypothetical protein
MKEADMAFTTEQRRMNYFKQRQSLPTVQFYPQRVPTRI